MARRLARSDTKGNLMSLGEAFDPRRNALNVWRLLLAAEVILWHSFLATGHTPMVPHAAFQLTWSVGVDGFFAISGFLITRSWAERPKARCRSVV